MLQGRSRRHPDVLVQIAARRDVEDLHPPADTEDRPARLEEFADQTYLEGVGDRIDASILDSRFFAEVRGVINVAASGKQQAVDATGDLPEM